MWQIDFSDFETTTGGTWRICGVADYYSKVELACHVAPTATYRDAIAAVEAAITEAERLTGTSLLAEVTDTTTGEITPIRLVSDNGAAFRAVRFAFVAGGEVFGVVTASERADAAVVPGVGGTVAGAWRYRGGGQGGGGESADGGGRGG